MKKSKLIKSGVALSLMFAGLIAVPQTLSAAPTDPPIINLGGYAKKTTISKTTFAPGVVEFHVTTAPLNPDGVSDNVLILKTDKIDLVLEQIKLVFTAAQTPAGAAKSALSMRTVHQYATVYGGGGKGTVWQVNLPAGNYYAITTEAVIFGEGKPVKFTVTGSPDTVSSLRATQLSFEASGVVGANQWAVTQTGKSVQWVQFANNSQEFHFLFSQGVKSSTTKSMISGSLTSNKEPTFFNNLQTVDFEAISPGVTVVFKQAWKAGKHLVVCFIPGENDGTPHALQGMWKLFTVK